MRAGISRVVVEVIILVIAVALALLIFSPVGSYIFGALGRTSSVGGQTTIAVINAGFDGSGNLHLYIKNVGPNDVDLQDTSSPSVDWQVFINNVPAGSMSYVGGTVPDPFTVDSVIEIQISSSDSSLSGLSETSSFTIVVYGPQGTQTEYLYRGG